jgi:hypothetical protein
MNISSFIAQLRGKKTFGDNPQITENKALCIAKRECERRAWPWKNAEVVEGVKEYRVRSNAHQQSGTVYIAIDKSSGEIKATARSPH